jgi:hypothetical protein
VGHLLDNGWPMSAATATCKHCRNDRCRQQGVERCRKSGSAENN